jgi:hypothetical protein
MNHYRRTLCLFIGCVLVLSERCITLSAGRDYQIRPGSGKGLVVVSFTQPWDEMQWVYRNLAHAKRTREYNEDRILTADLYGHPIVRYGETFLCPFELPAGEYEFFRWNGPEAADSPRSPVAWYEGSAEDFSIKFRCVADQVTYIGHVQLDLHPDGKFTLGVRDMRETDIAELIKAYKNIRPETIRVALMERPVRVAPTVR